MRLPGLDDDAAREALLAVLADVGFWLGATLTPGGRWRADTTLRNSLVMIPADAVRRIEEGLAAFNESRGGGV